MGTLQKDVVGQFALNDWYEQRNNEATVKGVAELIQPVQEMMIFQRRFRNGQLPTAPVLGASSIFTALVPRDEMWRLHWIGLLHTDSASLTVTFTQVPARGPVARIGRVITVRVVAANVQTPLFPSMGVTAVGNTQFDQRGGSAPEFLPGDQMQITTSAIANAGGAAVTLIFRIEVLPPPSLDQRDTIMTGVTVGP